MIQGLMDMLMGTDVVGRRDRQFSHADVQLLEAQNIMAELDRRARETDLADMSHEQLIGEAIARSLVGLLVERMSQR